MNDHQIKSLLKKGWDMHVHMGPDVLPRKYLVEDLVKQEKGKLNGILVKSHAFPTGAFIRENYYKTQGIYIIPSITLNNYSGWPNPDILTAQMILHSDLPCCVWFPTIHAKNHLDKTSGRYEFPADWARGNNIPTRLKKELTRITVLNEDGSLRKETNILLKRMQKRKVILATGHLSAEEAFVLAKKAISMGIKVIITHPHEQAIMMPLEQMIKLAKMGAFIEISVIPDLDRSPGDIYPSTEEIASQIRYVGPRQILLTSDTGQVSNPSPSQCLTRYIKTLSKYKLKEGDFEQILIDNPERLLFA